jgi:hypothetical protein
MKGEHRMKTALLLLLVVVGLAIAALRQPREGDRGRIIIARAGTNKTAEMYLTASSDTKSSEPPGPALGHLETRHRVVTILAGSQASYTIMTKDGKLLAENISADRLRTQFPDLTKLVESGLAGGGDASLNQNRPSGRILDARAP